MNRIKTAALLCAGALALAGCGSDDGPTSTSPTQPPVQTAARNVIFFLGDGMGMTTLTAARIYGVGEDGALTIDTLPETAFVKTYSNDAQVTDSAPSMSAYMTGVKTNNEVISMSPDTKAIEPSASLTGNCGANNGKSATTLLEIAKAKGMATGVVTTTRVTHATPAATYAHVCHRDAENDIAAQLVPGGAGYNGALGDGVDVVLGGGTQFFVPKDGGGKRTDGRNLVNELKAKGYAFAQNRDDLLAADATKSGKLVGLFSSSHMSYDLDRGATKEPSLTDMATRALDVLQKNPNGYFLMVEGGRIDHALHDTNAKRALQDTVAFDNAIKATLDKVRKTDPDLKNTLIVVTADHDHTLVLNGYAARTGKTEAGKAGVLGVLRNYQTGAVAKDADGAPYTIIGFGNGENRVQGSRAGTALTDAVTGADDYRQEAVVRMDKGNETHGGTDVFLGAIGRGADAFHGVIENNKVFELVRNAVQL
ncbi:TPA: alkaline phosphatase [Burkholderia cepacia]|uniref:Alkaline phosphatase n=1 Tax=Burkholderia cepacia TaxID=292 RepID=A0AAQ0FJL4_BURCE|nr:alkaline phosphatase [Burkholderia cepacia]HDR9762127.1 alkaline phosphatase [Burkholderia cepacia ATCC 25416]KAB1591858.1 sulfatase-like hydrolase/transferase [Burkholderia cepacia]KUY78135.1 alkaline phosphatase [Burkholderia cepacia]KVF60580.1 alkaline phosphatase [Burkholderia cepacia]KVH72269.1 alkaline phosphatase [Burkholderia cepacia]